MKELLIYAYHADKLVRLLQRREIRHLRDEDAGGITRIRVDEQDGLRLYEAYHALMET